MPKDNNSQHFKDWTTKKLKEEAMAYHQTIYEVECYSSKDLMNLDGIMTELHNRDIEPSTRLTFPN